MSKTPAYHKLPWIAAAIKRSKAIKKTTKPLSVSVGDRFSLRVGIVVFGTPSYFSLDGAISEFKEFVEQNSKFVLDIVFNKYSLLALDEYHVMPGMGGCKFVDPKYVHPETRARLPDDVEVQIMLFDIQSTKVCYGGLAYQKSHYTKNAPFIGIPFGDSIKFWGVEPNWKTKVATTLVHEFYHALTYIFRVKGIKLPNPDKANLYGFKSEDDPGWVKFDKFIYKKIEDEMYLALTQ